MIPPSHHILCHPQIWVIGFRRQGLLLLLLVPLVLLLLGTGWTSFMEGADPRYVLPC
jgi:hypothetical protein